MQNPVKKDALTRLAYIEGHLAGVRKMVEEDRYCVDILRQTHAIRRAVARLEEQLVKGHLHTCVVDGVREGREDQVLGELAELFSVRER
ncbi:MAG: metal-sensitive transcriptional regulator [Chloroflexi bacterium]|nr:metal-sensitive transcriptional regulator [Chloroflexota bacterium]